MSDRPKLIYLARRHPALDAAAFAARWRAHGRLGMSLPRWRNVWRYAQCDAVPDAAVPFPPERPVDGVGLVWYRSDETRRAHAADPDRARTAADELETFDGPLRPHAFLARERVLLPPRSGNVALFAVVWGHPAMPRADAAANLGGARADRVAGLLADVAPEAGYVVNAPWDAAAAGGLGCAAIEEVSLPAAALGRDAVRRALDTLVASAAPVARHIETVLVRPELLYAAEEG